MFTDMLKTDIDAQEQRRKDAKEAGMVSAQRYEKERIERHMSQVKSLLVNEDGDLGKLGEFIKEANLGGGRIVHLVFGDHRMHGDYDYVFDLDFAPEMEYPPAAALVEIMEANGFTVRTQTEQERNFRRINSGVDKGKLAFMHGYHDIPSIVVSWN